MFIFLFDSIFVREGIHSVVDYNSTWMGVVVVVVIVIIIVVVVVVRVVVIIVFVVVILIVIIVLVLVSPFELRRAWHWMKGSVTFIYLPYLHLLYLFHAHLYASTCQT